MIRKSDQRPWQQVQKGHVILSNSLRDGVVLIVKPRVKRAESGIFCRKLAGTCLELRKSVRRETWNPCHNRRSVTWLLRIFGTATVYSITLITRTSIIRNLDYSDKKPWGQTSSIQMLLNKLEPHYLAPRRFKHFRKHPSHSRAKFHGHFLWTCPDVKHSKLAVLGSLLLILKDLYA